MTDKTQHVIVSAAIVIVTVWICRHFFPTLFIPCYQLIGGALAFIWGYAKEQYDASHGGIFDRNDLVADMVGICLGILISQKFQR